MTKPLHFTAFQMLTPGDNGVWRDPQNIRNHLDLNYWIGQAQLLERAGFDAMFFADILGVFETRESGAELSVRDAHVFPLGDPFTLVSALAAATRSLGFVVTASTTYEPPFLLARRFSTLDHFTGGRIGWNIVTSYLDSAAANFGLTEQVTHADRYARADEYIEVLEKLWLQSWEADALRRDKASGVYADPAKVRAIDHRGAHYAVRGPHLVEPSPQGRPVYFQATASDTGFDFAIRHAEALYTNAGNPEQLKASIERLEGLARTAGRTARPLVFAGINLAIGASHAEAEEKLERQTRFRNDDSILAWNGIDIRRYPRDTRLSDLATYGTTRPLRSVNGRHDVTIQDYIEHTRRLRTPFTVLGTPDEVVDQIADLAARTGLDGFNISSATTPGVYEDFADHLTARLRARGLLAPPAATPIRLRDRLAPAGIR
ncbi:NtaA/DmoA family FMN-dependent monooxygenase [Thauera sinica]|uniref:NtaA/DmoA family FMN-dependent monooxygenase n=1 Tax=Thauera sinica TaxID=2665146 RepID=A0ABW1AMY9_9RHOO|nr:NtaA/DmoA family FMN-dependent monooxygenase [Thauera sp. K11]ATE60702.1 N5,N10-methylene tetrahydromethanopterin reductase [Thauera sp. K11]